MCFEIGNKVVALDDIIRGTIIQLSKEEVWIVDENGMKFQFRRDEVVKIKVEQNELSKYIDINNPLLRQKQNLNTSKAKTFVKDKKETIMEVDLHIEKLLKSKKGMKKHDILTYQLDTAKRKLEFCIRNRITKIVFIHGVGEGILKSELNYLLNRYPVTYTDASYRKYGEGATEVYIFQNHP